jgi:D-amino peptidase
MTVFISVDIEGVAGVVSPEQTRPGNPEYERARRLMTQEAAAAVRGALAARATEILVADSHGGFRNLLAEELPRQVRLIAGKPRPMGMLGGLHGGCAAVLLVGYHARAGSRGILAHTVNSSAFAQVILDGKDVGEAALNGVVAAEMGVPVLMASGDDALAEELERDLPSAEAVVVKHVLGARAGSSLSPAAAQELIEASAVRVLSKGAPARPPAGPVAHQCEVRTTTQAHADLFSILPGVSRVGPCAVTFHADSALTAVRTINSLSAMSAAIQG